MGISGFVTFYLISLIVLLIIVLVRQGNFSRKMESELDDMKAKMNLLLRKQEQMINGQVKPADVSADAPAPVEIPVPVEIPAPVVTPVSVETPAPVEETPTRTIQAVAPDETSRRRLIPVAVPEVRKPKKAVNYEKMIGENLFGKIGILVFVVGVGLFVKYAIDKDWINETMRTVLGFLIGSALLFVAERLREKYRTFSSLLAGGAFAVFYLTVSIAFHYYHLFSQTMAFVVLVVITVLMSTLALLYDRRELATIALVGGFLAPFIVSTGQGNYLVLFTYIAILNIGMFFLSMYKKWKELPIVSFAFSYIVLGLYVFDAYVYGIEPTTIVSTHMLCFCTLFYLIFLLPLVLILKSEGVVVNRVLLSIVIANNFLYMGFGSLFLAGMSLPFKATGLLSLFIAAVNCLLAMWLKKNERDYHLLLYAMIGLVLTFVSITVPIQLDGHYITLFWASEMVLLLWLYIRSQIRVYEYAAVILALLTGTSFMLDLYDSYHVFVTSLFVSIASGAFAWLLSKYRDTLQNVRILTYTPWNAIMWVVSVAIFYYAFMEEIPIWSPAYADLLRLLLTVSLLGAICFGFRKRFPISHFPLLYLIVIGLSVFCPLSGVCTSHSGVQAGLLSWIVMGVIAATLVYVARMYYTCYGVTNRFTVYLNVLAVLLWLTVVDLFMYQVGLRNENNAAFSIGLAVAGFVQMLLGMRLHQKVLRMISLVVFGIVLGKLVLIDLWAMPTIGKITVFIMLGALLLVLSFLYQKLKNVLFKDSDEENTN